MAGRTARRLEREARPGGLFPSEAVARNIRAYRAVRGMTQAELAKLMDGLGLEWTDGTVGFVERGDRAVTVDEYFGLALCFGVPVGVLVDPTGPDGRNDAVMDFAGVAHAGMHVDGPVARNWALGKVIVQYSGGKSLIVKPANIEERS